MTNLTDAPSVQTKKKKRKSVSLERKKARAGWIFVLPFVIGLIIIYLPIVFESLKSTLFLPDAQGGTFYGFKSYVEAFTHKDASAFAQTLVEGISDIVLDIPMILLFSLFMAVLLNQKMAGRAAFRAIFFVPVILSTGIMDKVAEMTNIDTMTNAGAVDDGSGKNSVGQLVNSIDMTRLFSDTVPTGMLKYVTDAINNIFNIVNRSGVQMLIFLAGLQSISPAIYESVQIDGASAWETFWKITFPMISPMILVNAVYTVIDAFTLESSVMSYITNLSISADALPVKNAMMWIYFLLVIAILGIVVAVLSAYTFYQRKKS